jgi:hypothetical protein
MTKDEMSRQETREVAKETKTNEKSTHESKSVKKSSPVEIIRQELESVENEPQVSNESLHINIEQPAEPLIDELMNEAMVSQSDQNE